MLKKWLKQFKNRRYYLRQYKLEHDRWFILELIGRILVSIKFAISIVAFFTLINRLFVASKKFYIITSKSFNRRIIVFWVLIIIVLLFAGIVGIDSYSSLSKRDDLFPAQQSQVVRLEFNFNQALDLDSKYQEPNSKTVYEYASSVQAIVKTEITELLKNDPNASQEYDPSKLKFSTNDNAVIVDGSPDIIHEVASLESRFIPNANSNGIVTLTDIYGRPLVYGMDINRSDGDIDPTKLANPTYVINSSNKPDEDNSNNGKSLYEISENGKWWGKELKGTIFTDAKIASTQYGKFSTISFDLDSSGFFTAFTKYLYIMQADYQFTWQTVGSTDSFLPNEDTQTLAPNNRYHPNIKDKSTSNTYYLENQYIASILHHFLILIWVNQDKIFTSSVVKTPYFDNKNRQTLQYTFKWVDPKFKKAATDYESNADKTRKGDNGLDSSREPWYLHPDLNSNGFTPESDPPVNFLDFGFDHAKPFKLNPDDTKKADDPVDDNWDTNHSHFRTQEWGMSLQQPYTTDGAGGASMGGDATNPNFNVLHLFQSNPPKNDTNNKKDSLSADQNLYFTLGYGEAAGIDSKPSYESNDSSSKYSYSYFQDSPYGVTRNVANKDDIMNNLISDADNKSGLLGIVDITSDKSEAAGVKSVAYQNSPTDKNSGSTDFTADTKFYNSASWSVSIPTKTLTLNTANDNKNSYNITSYYVFIISTFLAPDFLYSDNITSLPSSLTLDLLRYILLVILIIFVILLIIYLLFEYNLFGLMVSVFSMLFILMFGIIIQNAKMNFNPLNLLVLILGVFIFLSSLIIVLSSFKKNYIAYKDRIKDRRIFSKRQWINFFNTWFILFLGASLVGIASASTILTQETTLLGIIIVATFVLIYLAFGFFVSSFLISKKYDSYDKYLFKFNDESKFTYEEKIIKASGLIIEKDKFEERSEILKRLLDELQFGYVLNKHKSDNSYSDKLLSGNNQNQYSSDFIKNVLANKNNKKKPNYFLTKISKLYKGFVDYINEVDKKNINNNKDVKDNNDNFKNNGASNG